MKKESQIDKELILAFRAGDQEAMAVLVKRWHLAFCTKSFWIVKDASLSKDIAQDCWQIIMDKIHTLENPLSFKSWALRIVYTKSFDALREISKKRLNENEFIITQEYNEEGLNDDAKLKETLLKAVKKLPEHQQMVIRLFYTEAYSLNEISKLLNISVGTTKSRLFHAREKLKLILKPIVGNK